MSKRTDPHKLAGPAQSGPQSGAEVISAAAVALPIKIERARPVLITGPIGSNMGDAILGGGLEPDTSYPEFV